MHAASFAYLKDARHIELLARDLMRSKLEETLNSDVDSECASASIGRQEAEKCFVGGCIELFAGSSPSTQQAVWRLFESDLKQRKVSGGGRDASALAMAQQNQLRHQFASAVWHSNPTACSSGDHELPAMIAASWPRLDLSTVGIPLRPSGVNSCTLRANMMITEIIQGEKLSNSQMAAPWDTVAMEDICSLQDPLPPSADGCAIASLITSLLTSRAL